MQQGFEVLLASADGPEVKDIVGLGAAHQVIPMTRQITIFQDIKCVFLMVRLIRQFKPDIIHTHTPKAGLIGMLAGWLTRVPVRLHTIAGLPWMEATGLRKKILQWIERLTYWCATRVYPNSVELRNFLITTLKFKLERTRVIGKGSSNGIDIQFYQRTKTILNQASEIRQRCGIDSNDFVFVFVGRLVRDKGIVELVQAFESLKRPNTWLLLVGHREQDLDPLPLDTITSIQNNPYIVEAGFQSDIRPWLAASNGFVFPSYREGFPNVVMQAACMELPCIVSDINGCRELIQQEYSGYIVPAKNTEKLSQVMVDLTSNLARMEMGFAARKYVCDNFDQAVIWQLILQEYKSFLGYLYIQK